MRTRWLAGSAGVLLSAPVLVAAQQAAAPLPDVRQLMIEVQAHQRQLDSQREAYTYTALETTQDLDASGRVTKTGNEEREDFFVNGHVLERTVKKNGKPLDSREQQKETERVTRLVEKAAKTPRGEPLEGPAISLTRLLDIVDLRNERRIEFRGRPTIVFDFAGRKDAKSHGLVEDASKKLQGTIWIDEADRQVAHAEVRFADNFRVAGGLFASVEKGSSFWFDQTQINNELWLPTGGEANVRARVLLLKSVRQHVTERDFDYKRFSVETQAKDGKTETKQ